MPISRRTSESVLLRCPSIYVLALLLGSLLGAGCFNTPKNQSQGIIAGDPALRDAYYTLLHSDVWISNRVYGYSGEETNRMAVALDILVKNAKGKDLILSLLKSGNPTGRLYALCGLYVVDPVRFDEEIKPFKNDTNHVITIAADTTDRERICDIVFSPYGDRQGEARVVLSRGQSVSEWLRQHDSGVRAYMDISGGGIPSTLIQSRCSEVPESRRTGTVNSE